MKKTIIALILIFVSFFAFAQEWERDYDFENMLLEDWGVDIQVWTAYSDGVWTVNFEDFQSPSWDDVYYNLAFTLAAFEEILLSNELDFREADVELFIFSWFERYNSEDPYNDETNTRWDIYMDYDWLVRYFNARFNQQYEMIDMVISPVYEEWLDQQPQLNYFNRKR